MANFLAVVDPDPARRAAYLAGAADRLQIVSGLRAGECASGAFAAVWAASELAPISVAADAHGAGVVWGNALERDGTEATAEIVRRSWALASPEVPHVWDGFYAAVAYDLQRGLTAGADVFGLFPVYYWSLRDVVVVSSSISAIRAHPSFDGRFNPLGLTGILLTGSSLDGETMWTGVRRLAPGCLVRWTRDGSAREVRQYTFPTEETLGAGRLDEHVAMLDDALERVMSRHVRANDDVGLLLSGGRDSRVVAGLLHRRGMQVRTLTLGFPNDYEALGASAVARTLRWPHVVAPDPGPDDLEELVRLHVRHEQLINGMSNVHTWGMLPPLAGLGSRILSGYWIEMFIGGWARALPRTSGATPAEDLVLRATSYGLAPAQLRGLLPRDLFGTAVDDCLERIRAAHESLPADPDRRGWQFDLHHRGRFHAGSTPWRMSLSRWPVMLALDRELVELCASFPRSTLVDRRAEDELLRTRFLALARLPLDRDSNDTEPLAPSLGWRVRRFITDRLLGGDTRSRGVPSLERRRYHRLFDINAPGWRAMRAIAEPGRGPAATVLNAAALDALLPAPSANVEPPYPVAGSNGLKSLIGFLVWMMDHA